MKLAPIVIFSYNRPSHLKKSFNYLKKINYLKSKLLIFFLLAQKLIL